MNLKQILKTKGITMKQLSETTRINYAMILRYANREVEMPAYRIIEICKALGVSADELLGMES
jgi:transcriptional regulator with XRE-family HTH domain